MLQFYLVTTGKKGGKKKKIKSPARYLGRYTQGCPAVVRISVKIQLEATKAGRYSSTCGSIRYPCMKNERGLVQESWLKERAAFGALQRLPILPYTLCVTADVKDVTDMFSDSSSPNSQSCLGRLTRFLRLCKLCSPVLSVSRFASRRLLSSDDSEVSPARWAKAWSLISGKLLALKSVGSLLMRQFSIARTLTSSMNLLSATYIERRGVNLSAPCSHLAS